MKQTHYQFKDFPVQYKQADYESVRKLYVERIAPCPDVKAIYQVGTVSACGISDLDLVLVLEDTLRHSKASDYCIDSLDKRSKYIFMHNPLILNESLLSIFRLFPFVDHLKVITAKKDMSASLDIASDISAARRLADVIDNMGSMMRFFTFTMISGLCPMRMLLVKLNALCINMDDAKTLGFSLKEEWIVFRNEIKELRKAWFSLDRTTQETMIVDFIERAFRISYEFSFYLQECIADAGYMEKNNKRESLLAHQGLLRFSIFSSYNGKTLNFWERMSGPLNRSGARYKSFVTLLPFAFYSQWLEYRKEKGQVSESFKRYLPYRPDLAHTIRDTVYRDMLRGRIQFLNEQAAFLRRNKFSYGLLSQPPVKLGFYGAKRNKLKKIIYLPAAYYLKHTHKRKVVHVLRRIEQEHESTFS